MPLPGANWFWQSGLAPAPPPGPPTAQPPFFEAADSPEVQRQNLLDALARNPSDADLHGRLGLAYSKSLDYEHAALELGCVVDGCNIVSPITYDQTPAPVVFMAGLPLSQKTLE